MKKNGNLTIEILFCLLLACYIALMVYLATTGSEALLIAAGLTVIVLAVLLLNLSRLRRGLSKLVVGTSSGLNAEQQSILSSMYLPVLVTDAAEKVLWYNTAFEEDVLGETDDIFLESITATIPDFDAQLSIESGEGIYRGDKHFTVYSNISSHSGSVLYVSFFVDDTAVNREAVEYKKTRPSVLLFLIDNYDEISVETGNSDGTELMAVVNRTLENFINSTNGILTKISTRSYLAVVEEQHVLQIMSKKFPILDDIRNIPSQSSMPVTLSIGMGRGAKTLYENYIRAKQALDMALGRGGDQAAVKTKDGYEFFGGVSRAVEKQNRVKSRIMASALEDLCRAADNIVLMGHKASDLDSLGSCIGLARIAEICGKSAKIVFDPENTMAAPLYERLEEEDLGDMLVAPKYADELFTKNTLAIVADCHVPAQLDRPELLKRAAEVVVIDHHRKMVDHIDNAVLFYHETYSSSCSEMVAELLQHLATPENKPTKLEAVSMLAGIMLDTKSFSVKTGVRTFDAAAYLRKLGADPSEAKQFFATGMDAYRMKSELVSSANVYKGCALVVADDIPAKMRVVVPQTADDLLNIDGTKASIVAVKNGDKFNISARSFGECNVQLIMERLGGGGHASMAGAEVDSNDADEVMDILKNAVDEYYSEMNKSKE